MDTIADNAKYTQWNATVEYRFKVNEVFDDGNRLDGEGYTADASLDASTPPCSLALNVGGEALRFVGFLNASTLVIFTQSRRLYADAETLQKYDATTIDVNVVSGHLVSVAQVFNP
jgi:hypothetical protein